MSRKGFRWIRVRAVSTAAIVLVSVFLLSAVVSLLNGSDVEFFVGIGSAVAIVATASFLVGLTWKRC